MSIKYMTRVWGEKQLEASALLVMLALADNANDQGICWPSLDTIAEKSRLSKRQVQRIIAKLEKDRWLDIESRKDSMGRPLSNIYHLFPHVDTMTIYPDAAMSGGDMDIAMSSHMDTIASSHMDTAASTESPSESPIEPPVAEDAPPPVAHLPTYADVARSYEGNIGIITQRTGELLKSAYEEYPAQWIIDAFGEAAKYNKRSWAYAEKVLRRWEREGRTDKTAPVNGSGPAIQVQRDEGDATW